MLEFLLGAGAVGVAGASAALVRAARRYEGGWSDRALDRVNERRRPGPTQTWLDESRARADHLAFLGYHTDGAPEGYAYSQNTSGDWVLVKIPEAALRPPPYDGPRGR